MLFAKMLPNMFANVCPFWFHDLTQKFRRRTKEGTKKALGLRKDPGILEAPRRPQKAQEGPRKLPKGPQEALSRPRKAQEGPGTAPRSSQEAAGRPLGGVRPTRTLN